MDLAAARYLVERYGEDSIAPFIVRPDKAYEFVGGGDLAGLILSWQQLQIEERVKEVIRLDGPPSLHAVDVREEAAQDEGPSPGPAA